MRFKKKRKKRRRMKNMDRYKEFMFNKDSHLSYGLGEGPTSTIQQHDRQQVE